MRMRGISSRKNVKGGVVTYASIDDGMGFGSQKLEEVGRE